jgi:hypothetical protein
MALPLPLLIAERPIVEGCGNSSVSSSATLPTVEEARDDRVRRLKTEVLDIMVDPEASMGSSVRDRLNAVREDG